MKAMGSKVAAVAVFAVAADAVVAKCTPMDGMTGEDAGLRGLGRRAGLGFPLKKERRDNWYSFHLVLGRVNVWMKENSKILPSRDRSVTYFALRSLSRLPLL